MSDEDDEEGGVVTPKTAAVATIDEAEIERNYTSNLIKMAILWGITSFTSYLLLFLNKYFEGTIYQNNYLECASGIVATYFGSNFYAIYGKKGMFAIAYSLVFVGAGLAFLIESGENFMPNIILSYAGGP